MIDELRALTSFAKSRTLHISGTVFRLHCQLTTICIIIGLFIVSTSQFVGNPIYCDSQSLSIQSEMLNAYCYIQSTYILANPTSNRTDQIIELYPGVLPSVSMPGYVQPTRVHYYYYQWIWVIYFIQALGFYLPNWIWKNVEGGRLRSLVSSINILDENCQPGQYSRLTLLADYIVHSFGSNKRYMLCYYLCELCSFINLLCQMYVLNYVFGGNFLMYGWDSVNSLLNNPGAKNNPMTTIFPKMTKCEYRRFGPSGHVDLMDSLCMLPLNNFNDKFFLILWFWIWTLLVMFMGVFLYRLLEVTFRSLRYRCLINQIHLVDSNHKFGTDLKPMLYSVDMGDWFLLTMVGHNLDRIIFYRLLCEVSTCYSKKRLSTT